MKLDTELINKKNAEQQSIVADGRFIESLGSVGKTPEDLVAGAKKVLGIGADDLIQMNIDTRMTQYNLQLKAFLELVNFMDKSVESELLTTDQVKPFEVVRDTIAAKIAARYEVEVEDLYLEGEE